MKAIIFDTETTGLNEPEIVSAAWMDVLSPSWEISELFFCPSKPIELGAIATHHILPSDVAGMPPSSSFALPEDVEYVIGWNPDYDCQAIGRMDLKRIDLCCIARRQYPGLDSYSQSAVYYHLNGLNAESRDELKRAHGAYCDVRNCRAIYGRMLMDICGVDSPNDMEELWRFSEECRVPDIMGFGKHKGLKMSEVPPDYRRWYANCTNPPPDKYILQAFEKYPFVR